MSNSLLDKARAAVEAAKQRGAQGVRAGAYRSRESSVEWRDGKVDRLRESTEMGLNVTLFVDGRYSANFTSDLRPEAIEGFLDETVAATKALVKDPHRKLPDPARYQGRFDGELALFDQAGAEAVTAVDRRRIAKQLEDAARSAPGSERIISVTTSCSDTVTESAKVTSNGMEGTRQTSTFSLFAETSIKGEADRKPEGWWYTVNRQRSKLATIESVGREATRRAVWQLGARPEKSGAYPCVVENAVVGRLLGGLLAPLGGQAIQQQRSFLAERMGQQVASARLSIVDDPLLVAGLASGTYDGEGMSTVKRPVFEQGVLRTFFLDTYYASKLGQQPTTSSWSNLVFPTGRRDLAGLLQAMGRGILIRGFLGGNSNSATGDFSVGVKGQWVAGGKPTRAVTEMNLAGNHLTFWKQLRELGNDPWPNSSTRAPSLRFGKVQFSGA